MNTKRNDDIELLIDKYDNGVKKILYTENIVSDLEKKL